MTRSGGWVYLVACAAPPVLHIEQLISLLSDRRWKVCLVATPTAATWTDLEDVAQRTGALFRAAARPPLQEKSLPRADAVLAAPLTFNTINKWAAGYSDSPALGVLNELLSADLPILGAPCVKALLRQHPAYRGSLDRLMGAGVTMLDPDCITFRGDDGLADFSWSRVVSAFDALVAT